MTRLPENEHSFLLERLAEPELFDPADMPTGRDYLHSRSKLLFDALAGMGVLPVTAVPTAAGALAIKIIDHETPLFRHERIGYMAKPFIINKLRTMPGVTEITDSNGRHDDPRRSSLGKVLSLLRIDESPQLVNVARREMSVIGPRPLTDFIFDNARKLLGNRDADEWVKIRSLALPGIFDRFSNLHHSDKIEGDDEAHLRQRYAWESDYILETASFAEDCRVMMDTLNLFGSTVMKHATSQLERVHVAGSRG